MEVGDMIDSNVRRRRYIGSKFDIMGCCWYNMMGDVVDSCIDDSANECGVYGDKMLTHDGVIDSIRGVDGRHEPIKLSINAGSKISCNSLIPLSNNSMFAFHDVSYELKQPTIFFIHFHGRRMIGAQDLVLDMMELGLCDMVQLQLQLQQPYFFS